MLFLFAVGIPRVTNATTYSLIGFGPGSRATGVNDVGQVSGLQYTNGFSGNYANVWNGTTPTALPNTLGGTAGAALGMSYRRILVTSGVRRQRFEHLA